MIAEWVKRLSEPSPATNGLPTCPYAKRAFEKGKVALANDSDIPNIIGRWSGQYDLVLAICDRGSMSPDIAIAMIDEVNARYEDDDFCVMVDHPDRPFVVDGHNNSNGDHIIFFVQRKSLLDKASRALKATGYYSNWPDKG